jgi:transposase InsO family protein
MRQCACRRLTDPAHHQQLAIAPMLNHARLRDQARADVFDYIEMFYNPTRKHARNGMLSPVEFERQHKTQAEGV